VGASSAADFGGGVPKWVYSGGYLLFLQEQIKGIIIIIIPRAYVRARATNQWGARRRGSREQKRVTYQRTRLIKSSHGTR
jgi:hypothetical protein